MSELNDQEMPSGVPDADARAVADLLAPLRAAAPSRAGGAHARSWAAIEARTGVERLTGRPLWQRGWLLAPALALAAAILVLLRPPEPAAVEPPPAPWALTEATRLPSGAHAAPVSGSEVTVVAASVDVTRLEVHRGAVESRVPPLGLQQRYLVETAHAVVEVRGTVFRVAVSPEGTTVEVDEGRVEVRPRSGAPTRMITAGERWSVPVGASARAETGAGAPHAAATAEPPSADPDWERGAVEAAERAPDGDASITAWRGIAEHPDTTDLGRRNATLRVGRLLERHRPLDAPAYWIAAEARFPDGAHADEFAFRALRARQKTGTARPDAVDDFLRRFPESPRAGTLQRAR